MQPQPPPPPRPPDQIVELLREMRQVRESLAVIKGILIAWFVLSMIGVFITIVVSLVVTTTVKVSPR